MVECGHDVTVRSQKLGEPGVIEAVAAAPMGEHDERMLRGAERRLGILMKVELDEERHGKRRGGPAADRGGAEHAPGQMAAALMAIGVFQPSDPYRQKGAALPALVERWNGRTRA